VSVVSSAPPLWASGACAGVHAAGCRHVVYVPDNPLSHVLREFAERFSDVRLILATREEEAFGIAAGLYLAGATPALMFQSSGVGNSLNAITSLFLPYQIPALMIVSMRGDESEWNAAQVPMGRALPAILDAMAVPYVIPARSQDVGDLVRLAAVTAFSTRTLRACLLPRRITSGADAAFAGRS
jgi:sulfopyruvate decarboxylase subunit alpha